MKIYVIILAFLLFNSCISHTRNDAKNADSIETIFFPNEKYPEIISSNKLDTFYNNSKWLFYASNYACNFSIDDKRDSLISYTLVNHELLANCFFEDSLISLHFLPLRVPYDSTIKIRKTVYSFDSNYFVNFETSLNYDDVKYRQLDGCVAYPGYEKYYRDTIKYSKEVDELRKMKILSIKEQLDLFNKYLQNTNDTLTPWLKFEAKRRGVIK